MRISLILLACIFFGLSPIYALQRDPAPYDKVLPYKGNYVCYGRWIRVKLQGRDEHGGSVTRSGVRCIDDKKIRRQMVERQGQPEE